MSDALPTPSETPNLYVYPELGGREPLRLIRMFGPGLGNSLFPWARAWVASHRYGAKILAPVWPQWKIGSFLRREADGRQYRDLLNADGYVAGWERWRVLTAAQQVRADELGRLAGTKLSKPHVAIFRPEMLEYDSLQGWEQSIREELWRLTMPEHRPVSAKLSEPRISAHIRQGDFQPVDEEAIRRGVFNVRLPLRWYRHAFESLQQAFPGTAIDIYSDGPAESLAELLTIPGTRFVPGQSVLTDLWMMANSAALVTSISSLSGWAAYLDQTPAVWYPAPNAGLHREIDAILDYDTRLSDAFLARVRQRLNR